MSVRLTSLFTVTKSSLQPHTSHYHHVLTSSLLTTRLTSDQQHQRNCCLSYLLYRRSLQRSFSLVRRILIQHILPFVDSLSSTSSLSLLYLSEFQPGQQFGSGRVESRPTGQCFRCIVVRLHDNVINMYWFKIGFSRMTPVNLNGCGQNFTGICRPNSNVSHFGALGFQRGANGGERSGCFVTGPTMKRFFFVTEQIGMKFEQKRQSTSSVKP